MALESMLVAYLTDTQHTNPEVEGVATFVTEPTSTGSMDVIVAVQISHLSAEEVEKESSKDKIDGKFQAVLSVGTDGTYTGDTVICEFPVNKEGDFYSGLGSVRVDKSIFPDDFNIVRIHIPAAHDGPLKTLAVCKEINFIQP